MMMNKGQKHNLMIAFGIFTALVVVFSQLFFFQASAVSKKEVKTEKQDDKQGHDASFITLPSSSLPSSTSVEPGYASFCLLEILFVPQPEADLISCISLSPEKLFHTLFRFIISPNAP